MQSAIAVRPSYEHTLVDVPVVPQAGEHSSLTAAAVALRQGLVSKVVQGLRVPTGDAWFEYWDADDRLDDFTRLLQAVVTVTRATGISAEAEARQQAEAAQRAAQYFVEAAEELRFADATMERAVRIVGRITKVNVPPQLQKDDAACAQRFNLAAKWYTVASAALQIIADDQEPAPRPLELANGVLESVFACIRLAALEAHHAAMEGSRLRAQPALAEHDVQAAQFEDLPDDFEELERKIQSIEVH
ncbi:MAG TPA: hypothetical protein VHT91_41705 [Kofleriaceae bacterium]|nr:hypothetical protein [Kofleriaceae bacterium]